MKNATDDIVFSIYVCHENVKDLFKLECVLFLFKNPISGTLASVMYMEDCSCSTIRIASVGEELVKHRSGVWSTRPFDENFEKTDDIYYDGGWFPFGY